MAIMAIMAICRICNTNPSKYKCPSCKLPYCSPVCYKPHKAEHEKSKPAEPTLAPIGLETTEEKSHDQIVPIEPGPFVALLTSPEVQQMLGSPSLRRHLLNVHKATLEPPPGFAHYGRGGGRGGGGRVRRDQNQRRPWNAEKGTRAGVGKLKRLREDNIEVDEFVNIVMGLVERDTAEEV